MALMSGDGFLLLLRWIHFLSGITWIGLLYYFNLVQVPFFAETEAPVRTGAIQKLVPRALWWFRWGAMMTFAAGLVLFVLNYAYTPGLGFGMTNLFKDAYGVTGRAWWIMFGMLLGTIMWFNVWFIIWPTQKAIFSGKFAGDALAAARKKAAKFSRINTHLSGPMLFGMLAAPHYGSFNIVTLIVFMVIAEATVMFAYKISPNVGKTV